MRCTVLLFAQLRDAVGSERLQIDLPDDATGDDLINALAEKDPSINQMKDHLAVAVGDRYQPRSKRLKDGDEIAIIPPVSGG